MRPDRSGDGQIRNRSSRLPCTLRPGHPQARWQVRRGLRESLRTRADVSFPARGQPRGSFVTAGVRLLQVEPSQSRINRRGRANRCQVAGPYGKILLPGLDELVTCLRLNPHQADHRGLDGAAELYPHVRRQRIGALDDVVQEFPAGDEKTIPVVFCRGGRPGTIIEERVQPLGHYIAKLLPLRPLGAGRKGRKAVALRSGVTIPAAPSGHRRRRKANPRCRCRERIRWLSRN